ncbi:MAG: phosphoglucomutase/phosphomannomutase family protein [Chloroflexi bacterium]|nr:phosphoglucomutase/phosphomannomutase family protein [Chloroflexota bacterium]MCL5074030.1 phosphoglucomutase/phosphomannomutase family protein [Chloroflexota bacterium]
MINKIRFGTDGWRAIFAEDYTFENVRFCAQGVADYLKDSGRSAGPLVVGYDTRFASEHFAAAVAEVTAANGIKTLLCERTAPTPVISYSVVQQEAAGAVIITSSHNPPIWNGVKYKPEYGGSASPQVIAELEERIDRAQSSGHVPRLPLNEALRDGIVTYFAPEPIYLSHIANLVDLERLRGAGFHIVADAMYGAGMGCFKSILGGGKTVVTEINGERNPLFPGLESPEPIARNLTGLMRAVRKHKAHIGLATDGDSDRIGVVDENGQYVNQLQAFALLALYVLEIRGWRGALVKSINTTSMINRLGELYSVPVFETAVGFKHVGLKMMEEKAIIAGEESGGFAFKDHIPERDGILAGLYILDMMIELGCTPSQLVEYLFSKVGPRYYDRIDTGFPAEKRDNILRHLREAHLSKIAGLAVTDVQTIDGFKFFLEDGSWLLIRFSGTEPIMRIYAEAGSPSLLSDILRYGQQLIGL